MNIGTLWNLSDKTFFLEEHGKTLCACSFKCEHKNAEGQYVLVFHAIYFWFCLYSPTYKRFIYSYVLFCIELYGEKINN